MFESPLLASPVASGEVDNKMVRIKAVPKRRRSTVRTVPGLIFQSPAKMWRSRHHPYKMVSATIQSVDGNWDNVMSPVTPGRTPRTTERMFPRLFPNDRFRPPVPAPLFIDLLDGEE